MLKKMISDENIDRELLKKLLPGVDINRVYFDYTDYTCFKNLYLILKRTVKDPRRTSFGHIKHDIWEIFTIIIICTIFGVSIIKYIVDQAHKNIDQFKLFLDLKNGMPKYDTFLRALHDVNPDEIAIARKKWLDTLPKLENESDFGSDSYYEGEKIAIHAQDGKSLRGSGCIIENKKPTHIISNIDTTTMETYGEIVVDKKSNEISGNLELVNLLGNLKGTLTTFDAMGCQKNLASEINNQGGLWLFQVKRNQPNLYEDLIFTFENKYTEYESILEKNRDRWECRSYFYSNDIKYLPCLKEWPGVKAYGLVYNFTVRDGGISLEPHPYIMNFDNKELFVKATREHWAIENKLHYVADTVYQEDNCKVRRGNAPAALNIMRKFGVTLFTGIKKAMKKICSIKRLANLTRNSISDLAEIINGNFEVVI